MPRAHAIDKTPAIRRDRLFAMGGARSASSRRRARRVPGTDESDEHLRIGMAPGPQTNIDSGPGWWSVATNLRPPSTNYLPPTEGSRDESCGLHCRVVAGHELSKRGVVGNLVGFSTFYSADNPPSAIIDAVASGKVGVAIVWGPAAGYFVKQQTVALAMVPVPSGPGDLPFEFGISMGVKPGNVALKNQLEKVIDTRRAEITKILNDYNVPLVQRKAGLKK